MRIAKCSIEGCEGVARARSMCNKHYSRFLAHGSPDDPRPSVMERFMSYVEKTDYCWLWTGAKFGPKHQLRGVFFLDGRQQVASRASFQLFIGTIPDDMVVCHSCDNHQCVNPEHLWLGTQKDNIRDMWAKGRQVMNCWKRGADHPRSRLTEQHVTSIRERHKNGETQASLAREFDVSFRTIHYIVKKVIWKHVP